MPFLIVRLPCIFPSHVDLPEPFHTWDFDTDLGGWANDFNNWNQKWSLDGGGVCLHGKSPNPIDARPQKSKWAFADDEDTAELSAPTEIKARLWSGKIPAKFGMQCLTLLYSISLGEQEAVGSSGDAVSLGLLQRQEG